MKLLFTALFCLVFFAGQGQVAMPTDPATGKIVYRGSIQLPSGVTPTQAFGRSKLWLADVFSGKKEIANDAATGLLSGGGALAVNGLTYTFRVRLQVEAAQVQYRLDDFAWAANGGRTASDRGTAEEQRDSRLAIGRKVRVKMQAELDQRVRAGLAQLATDLTGAL